MGEESTRLAPAAEASARFVRDMQERGRMVCEDCGIHAPPADCCPNCGGRLVPLDR